MIGQSPMVGLGKVVIMPTERTFDNSMLKFPRCQLDQLLQRDANNLDLIRLICACAVIFGHSFVLIKDPGYPLGTWDPCKFLRYEGVYSASVAVKVFFFISGLLVTNSLLERKSVTGYVCGRVFRIWPAYIVILLFTAFIVGPLFTTLTPGEYFSQRAVYAYPVENILMLQTGTLPGVFSDNPLPNLVNGALWTLPYEVVAYQLLLLVFLLGIHRRFLLCTGLVLLILIDPLLPGSTLFPWSDPNPQFAYLPPCFAIGAYLALMRHRISFGWETIVSLIVAFLFLKSSRWGPLLFLITLFITLLYISGTRWMRRLRLPFDCSYGTFVWGFVIQQMMADKYADKGLVFNLVISLIAALAVGFLSWHYIEKPAIAMGRRVTGHLKAAKINKLVSAAPAGEMVL